MKLAKSLIYCSCIRVNVKKVVLGEFSRYNWHVRGVLCKDVPVLTDELDERTFLFVREVCPNGELLERTHRGRNQLALCPVLT